MKRSRLTYFIIISGTCMVSLPLTAQQDSLLLRNYEYVKNADPWLTSMNASALTRFSGRNISEATICLQSENGSLVDFHQAARSLQAEAEVEAFQRLSKRAVAYGQMSYVNFSGRDMAGSAFINPSRLPFDIVEDSLVNTGTKHLDTYRLIGGISISIWQNVAIGARLDYTAANYAKYKDLRHKNKHMDLAFSLGAYASPMKWISIGANYEYQRTTESLNFSTYGKNEKVYKSLINYGAFMGRVEQFGGNGYTDANWTMPLVNDIQGGAFQIELHPSSALSFFQEISVLHRTGYYGRKSPNTITYTHHHSNQYHYRGIISFKPTRSLHQLSLDIDAENLENLAETYRELKNDAGASYYQYYDPVKTGNKLWVTGTVAYTARLGLQGDQATWTLQSGLRWLHRKQTAYDYPFYRRQKINRREEFIRGERQWLSKRGIFSLLVGGSFMKGDGKASEDGTFITPSDKQDAPNEMTDFLMREYEYLTEDRFSVEATVKYAFCHEQLRPYMAISGHTYKTMRRPVYLEGSSHTTVRLSFGCTF